MRTYSTESILDDGDDGVGGSSEGRTVETRVCGAANDEGAAVDPEHGRHLGGSCDIGRNIEDHGETVLCKVRIVDARLRTKLRESGWMSSAISRGAGS